MKRLVLLGNRDSGAVAVETALVSLLLLTLLCGIVESAFLYKDSLAVSAASRAGARMGASQPRLGGSPDFAQLSADQVTNALSTLTPANIQEVWVYQSTGATRFPDSGSFTTCNICVKFHWSGTSLVRYYNNWPASSQNACSGDVLGPAPNLRDSLGVYVKYRHSSVLGFFFTNNVMVSESTVMWIEPWFATPFCKP
jgi:Flp pilus assembly protein TadG